MNCLAYNLYLCDLEFLGAEIVFMDKKPKHGKRHVRVSLHKGGSYELTVRHSPQGHSVSKVKGMSLCEFSEMLSRQFNVGTDSRYMLFAKLRRMKVMAMCFLAIQMSIFSVQCAMDFFALGRDGNYAIMACLGMAMVIDSFFVKREVLKMKYQDYCDRLKL